MNTTINTLIEDGIQGGQTYLAYRELVAMLVVEGKTTGIEQREDLIGYTALNERRMRRWDKTLKIAPEAIARTANTTEKVTWVVLTESWCGDAAHVIPVLNKLAELNPGVTLKIVMRDKNEALMDQFLTNGGRSIPKLIAYDTIKKEVKYTWGPRPSVATKLVNEYKAEHGALDLEFKETLQKWYNTNRGQAIVTDMLALI